MFTMRWELKFQILDEFLDSTDYGNNPYGKQKLYVYLTLLCLYLESTSQVMHPSGLCTPLKTRQTFLPPLTCSVHPTCQLS
jgi:hypothetical protein